ncbi:MAG: DUF6152 family protein [Caulobacteraceae bacterium]
MPLKSHRGLNRARAPAAFAIVLLMAGSAAQSAFAHHSGAMFDRTRTVEIKGQVKSFGWTNPHAWVELEVRGPAGPEQWNIEGSSPTVMVKQGWSKSSMKPGDQVTLIVHPMRDGTKGGSLEAAVLADGRRVGGATQG